MSVAGLNQHHTYLVVAGVAVVLVLASIIGAAGKRFVARGMPHPGIDNLNARIKAWWVLALLVGAALYLDRAGASVLFGFASIVALREFTGATRPATNTERWLGRSAFLILLPAQYLLVYLGQIWLFAVLVPACLAVLLIFARANGEQARMKFVTDLIGGLLACVYCVSHVPALFMLEVTGYSGRNALLVLYVIIVAQSSDVLQYLWGKLAGHHKISPRLSPAKTVEGTIGGILSATALGGALHWLTPFTRIEAVIIAFAIALAGFAGGLTMSAFKRRRGIKDWGTLIPGHGGVLDRIDSLVLSAPVFYYIVRVGWE
jgi:phosphatidate cytidylyltransferase